MERVVRAVAELRASCKVPSGKVDANSPAAVRPLEALYNALDQLPANEKMLSPDVANYVNAPIYALLQRERLSDRETEYVLRILGFLFEFPWRNSLSVQMARQYISVCVYVMAPITAGQQPEEALKAASTEVRTAGFKCLAAIFTDAQLVGFSRDIQGPHVHGMIVLALNGLKVGKDELDQLAALKFLAVLLSTVVTNTQAILPNTASVLNNFIIGGYGYKHTAPRVTAIKVLSDLLVAGLAVPSEWTKNASVQVDKMLAKMAKDLSSYNEKVRAAIAGLATELATKCWDSLEICQGALLDILLATDLKDQLKFLQAQKYQKAIDQKMLEYMDSLSFTLTSHDPSLAVSQMNALAKYVKVKSSQVFMDALILRIQESLPPLSQSHKAMQRDTPDTAKIMKLIASQDSGKMVSLEDLQVGTGIDLSTQSALRDLLQAVGSTRCASSILASLLEQLEAERGLASVQSLWIATCLLEGAKSPESANDYLRYCYSVVDNSTSFYQDQKATPSVVALNTHLIGELALDPALDFEQHLVDGLFPVVDLLGSGHSLVISEAKTALAKIAHGCGYGDVKELILSNKDYILDGISGKLNTMNITPATLTMLGVLILMTGIEIVVYLDDIISSLFIILDRYHGYSSLVSGIFSVFSAIIEVMTSGTLPQIEPPRKTPLQPFSFEDLKAELARKPEIDADLLKVPVDPETGAHDLPEEEAPNSDNESDKDDFEPPMDTSQEWNAPIEKPVYMIAKRIFEKCTLFLTHQSAALQSNILRVASQCISVLSHNQNEFLPEINSIWPVVVARVSDKEMFVCESAFRAIGVICASAGDFMTSRIESLWNKTLVTYKDPTFYTRKWPDFSPEKRWINALCKCLAVVLRHTRLDFETFDSILWTLKPVIAEDHKDLRGSLESINADDVWLCFK